MEREVKMIKENLRIAGYVRVSTKDQYSNGLSVDGQQTTIQEYVDKNYPASTITFFIEPGKSGATIKKRKVLSELLNNLKYYDVVVVWRMDRLTRDVGDLIIACKLLNSNFVDLCSVSEHIDIKTPQGMNFEIMRTVMNSDVISAGSQRTKLGLYQNACSGIYPFGKVPFGYVLNSERKLVPDELKRNMINHIYHYYYNLKYSKRQTAFKLTEIFQNLSLRNAENYVQKVIKNKELYLGTFDYLGKEHDVIETPVISPNSFMFHEEEVRNRYDHLETRILCARCKSILENHTTTKKTKVYLYKYCPICDERINQQKLIDRIKKIDSKKTSVGNHFEKVYSYSFQKEELKRIRK